jgi:hypothetical protein
MDDANKGSVGTLLGVGSFSIGQGFLNTYPGLRSNYVVYFGANGLQPDINPALRQAISDNGLNLIQRNVVPDQLTSNNLLYTANRISNPGNPSV